MEETYAGRATIVESMRGLKIEIPARKNWLVIFILCGWLVGWLFGEVTSLKLLLSGFNTNDDQIFSMAFIFFWLLGWTVGGYFAIRYLFWMAFGNEIIDLEDHVLKLGKKWTFLSSTKSYDVREIKNLTLNTVSKAANIIGVNPVPGFIKFEAGSYKFEYGLKTISFGNGLDDVEAKHIWQKFKSIGFVKEN